MPLPGPEKSLLRYRGKASAELAPLTCYADLEVYSTPAPTVHIAQQQPARQTVAASSCYVAVGRCSYVPPKELRLRLTHHKRDSDKYHAVRSMLNNLLKLADHYLTWRRRTRPVSMTRREELEHRAATHCRECLASFETAEKKLHPCHGTGQYLGALCHIAAQTPKTIPVVFHNGGGYDFHFLLRYIATMGSPVSRAPQDSDNEGTKSEAEGSGEPKRPMPMAKAAPKAAPKGKAKAVPAGAPCRPRSSRATTATSASKSSASRARRAGPAEVRGQHERLPHELGQRRPQGLHPQAAAGALPADGLASPRSCARRRTLRPKDGLSNSGGRTATWSRRGTASCESCPCPSSTSAAPRRGRCPRCGSSTATTACWQGKR